MGIVGKLIQTFKKPDVIQTGMHIIRDTSSSNGTLGKLYWRGKYVCDTLEDPWNNNQSRMSCIPKGVYPVIPHGWEEGNPNGFHFTRVWEVTNVKGRIGILIHNGNTIDNTIGCILVGSSRGKLGNKDAVLNSMKTLDKLRATLPKFFTLTITGVVG